MMEFVLVVIALASLTLNILIYRQLRSQSQGVVLTVEGQWAPAFLSGVAESVEPQGDLRVQDPEPEPTGAEDSETLVSAGVDNNHQAWVNRKEIPLTETVYIPAGPAPKYIPGPLERPGGFV